jgi:malonyl CoA-acyl carrier protein transacylase
VKLLAKIGATAQNAFPKASLDPQFVADCYEQEGHPTPMLSISGISENLLQNQIQLNNQYVSENPAKISLFNGRTNFVVTGTPKTLYGLVLALRKIKVLDI